jgi:hypothetical protein
MNPIRNATRRAVAAALVLGGLVATLATPRHALAQDGLGAARQNVAVQTFLGEGGREAASDAPRELRQFGQLVGVWWAEQEIRRRDGGWARVAPALWAWRYALGGYAVQDLWFQSEAELPEYLGALGRDYLLSSTRVFDVSSGTWKVAWYANGLGDTPGADFGTLEGQLAGSEIVMTAPPAAGAPAQRITFASITEDAFVWTSSFSQDGGATWQDVMRVRARRIQ